MLYIATINFHSAKHMQDGFEIKKINANTPTDAVLKASNYCVAENERDKDYNNWIGSVQEVNDIKEIR